MRRIARERAMERVDAEARRLARRWIEVSAPSLAELRPAERRAIVESALGEGSRDVEIIRGYLLRPAAALADELRRSGFRRGVHDDIVEHALGAFRQEVKRLMDERFPPPSRPGAPHPPRSLGDALGRPRRGRPPAGPER